jgi:putative addiction module killer protein
MFEIRQSLTFKAWLRGIKDPTVSIRITTRLARLRNGLFGDAKPVGEGVSELRLDFGPGYRIYFKRERQTIILLLCGGDKKTQKRDIELAKLLAKESDDNAPEN